MTDRFVIDVVSDVICPWCFLGKRRLDAALAMVPEADVFIRWRPFMLDPTIPPEGLDRHRIHAQQVRSRTAQDHP